MQNSFKFNFAETKGVSRIFFISEEVTGKEKKA
jgi:hypothetical protein